MKHYKTPMLIDAFRLTANNHDDTVRNIIEHLSTAAGGWNHQRCVRPIRMAYDGVDDKAGLIKGCTGKGSKAEIDNAKIVEAVLPNVIGRKTQSFEYGRAKYAITPQIFCAMGPSFFIVENGVVKLVYIHARNGNRASLSNLAGLAAIVKSEILDQDFYGEPSDVEIHYVDKKEDNRSDAIFDLARLEPFLQESPEQTLGRFARAFIEVDEQQLAGTPKPREKAKPKVQDELQVEMDV